MTVSSHPKSSHKFKIIKILRKSKYNRKPTPSKHEKGTLNLLSMLYYWEYFMSNIHLYTHKIHIKLKSMTS